MEELNDTSVYGSSNSGSQPEAVRPGAAHLDDAAHPSGAVDWAKPRVSAILRAAVRCFARSGFDTTTAEIAAEIGIPKSVIYHYFDDKTTLVREAQRFAYSDHFARVKETLSAVPDRTGRAVVDILRHIWRLPRLGTSGFSSVSGASYATTRGSASKPWHSAGSITA